VQSNRAIKRSFQCDKRVRAGVVTTSLWDARSWHLKAISPSGKTSCAPAVQLEMHQNSCESMVFQLISNVVGIANLGGYSWNEKMTRFGLRGSGSASFIATWFPRPFFDSHQQQRAAV
jgi:hypothetical protein